MAALYGAQVARLAVEALKDVRRVLQGANPNPLFLRLLGAVPADRVNSVTPAT